MRSAIDLVFTSHDIELSRLCIPKISNEYKAHLIIDMCRSKKKSDDIILLLLEDETVLDMNLSLYMRALTFQDNEYNDSLFYALQHIKHLQLPECILLFSVIMDRYAIVDRILYTKIQNVEASLEILFMIGVYHNSVNSIRTILHYASWISGSESFGKAIAICETRSFLDLKTLLSSK